MTKTNLESSQRETTQYLQRNIRMMEDISTETMRDKEVAQYLTSAEQKERCDCLHPVRLPFRDKEGIKGRLSTPSETALQGQRGDKDLIFYTQ